MLSEPDLPGKSIENNGDCKIDETIALYEALQFGYFDDDNGNNNDEIEDIQDWLKNGVGVDGTPYHWE